jgi:hypothetical protein
LLKDSNVNASGVTAETVTATGNVVTDTILERTGAAGVTIDGVLLKDGGITATGTNTINLTTITADTINETTAGSGVTVDGVLIKDSGIANTFITNDGSADSPRGWAISTNADYTFTATGPSRARCTATSANRSVNLPTTGIKAGYEAEVVTACTSPYTITVKSSDGDTVDTMVGTKGRIRCVALQDAPTDATHWEVVQVEDAGTWTPATSGSLNLTNAVADISYGTSTWNRYGQRVFAQIGGGGIIGIKITTAGMDTGLVITPTGLPKYVNATRICGSVYFRRSASPLQPVPAHVQSITNDSKINIQLSSQTPVVNGDVMDCFSFGINYGI